MRDTPAQQPPPSSGAAVDRCAPDYVAPRYDCEARVDSCPHKDGLDSTDNYMSCYAGCMRTFTTGQVDRMIAAWDRYRAPDDKSDRIDGEPEVAAGCQAGGGHGGGAGLVGLALLGSVGLRGRRRRADALRDAGAVRRS